MFYLTGSSKNIKAIAIALSVIVVFIFQTLISYSKYHKETPLVIETINLTIESLPIQNKLLEGNHSILDIKLC